MRAIVSASNGAGLNYQVNVNFIDDTVSPEMVLGQVPIPFAIDGITTPAQLRSVLPGAISAWCIANGIDTPSTYFYDQDGQTVSQSNVTGLTASLAAKANTSSLATVATTGAYNDLTGKPSIPSAQVNSDWNAVSGIAQILNKPSLSTVATSGAYSDLSGKPSLATVATSGSYTDLSNKPTIPNALTFSTAFPTRTLNSAFQISSTYASVVTYSVDIGATLTLSGGATGTVTLQYADDSGFTTNVKTVQSCVNGNTGTLTIGLALTQTASATLTGFIPAGKYVKIITANTTGTPVFTFRTAQETLLQN